MRRANRIFPFIGVLIVFIGAIFLLKQKSGSSPTDAANAAQSESQNQKVDISKVDEVLDPTESVAAPAEIVTTEEAPLKLNTGNFETFVLKCFRGDACELAEDPMAMYKEFKAAQNHKANDLLLSFMRSKLRDPKFAARYKDTLKSMIEDFYPPQEKQFQEAAYYNYLGDKEKSLELYLDLQKKQSADPGLRPAPKLNIANTYYDLGRPREALPYYQAALKDQLSGQEPAGAEVNDTVKFIEDRIAEIKRK